MDRAAGRQGRAGEEGKQGRATGGQGGSEQGRRAGKAGGWGEKNLTAAVRAVLLFGVVGMGWEGKKPNCGS